MSMSSTFPDDTNQIKLRNLLTRMVVGNHSDLVVSTNRLPYAMVPPESITPEFRSVRNVKFRPLEGFSGFPMSTDEIIEFILSTMEESLRERFRLGDHVDYSISLDSLWNFRALATQGLYGGPVLTVRRILDSR